jgi:hypothetical protein
MVDSKNTGIKPFFKFHNVKSEKGCRDADVSAADSIPNSLKNASLCQQIFLSIGDGNKANDAGSTPRIVTIFHRQGGWLHA